MSESSHSQQLGPLAVEPLPTPVIHFRNVSGLVGVIAMALLALSGLLDSKGAWRSLLFGFHVWIGPTLGAMAFVMISHQTGGGWGVIFRRFGEAAFVSPLFWLMAIGLTLFFGYRTLFPWAHIQDFAGDRLAYEVMHKRLPWYSPGWFFARQLAYFFIWGFLAWNLRTGSLKLDHAPNPVLRRRLRKVSAAGIVLFFVTVTSYAMDYVCSRETNWYSSIIGFISAIEFGASGVALVTLTICYMAPRKPVRDYLAPQHLNDLGNILLALVILWQYTSFCQLLIQWNGNFQDDIGYYVHRGLGAVPNNWRFVALSLFLGHFLVPFFLLLMKGLKRKAVTLGYICGWLLVMRVVESLWVIAPANDHLASARDSGSILWTDPVALLGVGGVWVFLYLRALGTEPLIPQNATHQPQRITHAVHGTPAHAI